MAAYAPDVLFISDDKLKSLANTGVTPFYLYDELGIRQSAQQLQQQFQWCDGFQNYFPLRENANPALLRLLCECGLGVLACGRAELLLAKECGFHGEQLLYEPMFPDYEAASLAMELDAAWLLNSPGLIPSQSVSRVLLRVHPQCALGHPSRPGRAVRSKNGFMISQLMDAVRFLRVRNTPHIGLLLQGAGPAFQPGLFAARASALFRILPEIREKTGAVIDACCLGDGLAPSYRPDAAVPQLCDEAALIRRQYEALSPEGRPRLLTTLSKQLMEHHGILVSKVLEVRALSCNYLVLDASVCQYLRPALKQAYRHISLLGKSQTEHRQPYQIAGYLPEEWDRFGETRLLPAAEAGDYCVIHDVGCGGRSMPMLYAMQPLCAEYLLRPDGKIRQTSAACTEEQVLKFLTSWQRPN